MEKLRCILQKIIKYIYLIIFMIILLILAFKGNSNYPLQRNLSTSNFIILIIFIPLLFVISKIKNSKKTKYYYTYLISIYTIVFIMQCILIRHIYFYTDWDVKVLQDIVKKYFTENNLYNEYYLTIYPNNILLTTILIILRRIPLIGAKYVNTLYVNALLVNISGLLTNLSINNIKKEKKLCINYFTIPLIVLSPWITIPYSDTFALFFISLIIFIYSKHNKKNVDYFLLSFITILGYYIKPTVIIVFIAIIITEIIYNNKSININYIKKHSKKILLFILGIIFALNINNVSSNIVKFTKYGNGELKPLNYLHYLAMGENNETNGLYSQEDINESVKHDDSYNINKFKSRLFGRTFKEQITFFANKTLINYNDGSFSWGQEGVFFYKIIPTSNKLSLFLRNLYYNNGKYYDVFLQIEQIIWLFILLLCPFIIKKDNSKEEMVMILSIIGITIFLTIFEPRARYLYCYSELFVLCGYIGLKNIKHYINNFK